MIIELSNETVDHLVNIERIKCVDGFVGVYISAVILLSYNEAKQIGEYDEEKYWGDEAYRAEYNAKADAIKDDAYNEMLDMLFDIKNSNDILYIYVQKLDEGNETCTYIFDADLAEDRGVGSYGIYIVKQVMDEVSYEFKDGKNILTMKEFIK